MRGAARLMWTSERIQVVRYSVIPGRQSANVAPDSPYSSVSCSAIGAMSSGPLLRTLLTTVLTG